MRLHRAAAIVMIGLIAAACGTATLLPSGKILFVMGARMEVDPATGRITLLGGQEAGRLGHTATLLDDGRVLLAGGIGGSSGQSSSGQAASLATAEVYDPATGTATPTGAMVSPHAFHAATLLKDGRVLVASGGELDLSGSSQSNPPLATAETWDPGTGQWTAVGDLTSGRAFFTLSTLLDGRVLAVGGSGGTTGKDVLASAEVFDPGTGKWQTTGSMGGPRAFQTATVLADGRVLIVGGASSSLSDASSGSGAPLATAEIYDPASGTFTATGSLAQGRGFHTATMLDDGRVLIAGGADGTGPIASAEIFDPATGTFSATGNMAAARVLHVAVLLSDGRVAIFGGENMQDMSQDPNAMLATIDIYDPTTGTFSSLAITGLPSSSPAA